MSIPNRWGDAPVSASVAAPLPLVVLLGAMVFPCAAMAGEEGFSVGLSQLIQYDSNLYRLPDGAVAPRGERGDRISLSSVQLGFDRTVSRQRLRADLDLSHSAYRHHDDLDYTAPDGRLSWDWVVGRQWSGRLLHQYSETLAGFDDVGGTEQVIRRFRRSAGRAVLRIDPQWSVGAGVAHSRSWYKDGRRPLSEFEARTLSADLTWTTRAGNRLQLSVQDADGRYPNRPAATGSIRDYRQRQWRVGMDWQLTAAFAVNGELGHTSRTYALAPARDFSGTTGQLALRWVPTAKLALNLRWRRDIGAEEDLVANYALTRVLAFEPVWAVTSKISAGLIAERRQRDYGGDPELGFGGLVPRRDDRTERFGLWLSYQPLEALTVQLRAEHQRRRSALATREFDADTVSVQARWNF